MAELNPLPEDYQQNGDESPKLVRGGEFSAFWYTGY